MSRGPMSPGFPGMPPNMNPQMMQQLAARMRQGGMRPGMPPGGMPPGMMPGQQAPNKEQFNPLPEGKNALQILKAHSGCVMPREAATLNTLLTKAQETTLTPTREKELYAAMAEAITLIFRSDHECEKQLATRTAGLFNEEPELKDLSDKLDTLDKELTELKAAFDSKQAELNQLAQARWEKAIKLFGLNIQERFYRIDDEKRLVQQLDLRCESCNGVTLLRDARQELARVLLAIQGDEQGVQIEAPKNGEVPGGFPPPEQEKSDGRAEVAADPGPGDGAKGDGQPAGAPDDSQGEGGTAS